MKHRLSMVLVLWFTLPLAGTAGGFDAASAINRVGLDVYRQLAETRPGQNLLVSPYSIESALALAYVGAEGTTRTELARALYLPPDEAPIQVSLDELRSALDQVARQSKASSDARRRMGGRVDSIEWHVANRLFGQRGYAFRQPFLTLMQDGFAAPFEQLNFRNDAEQARGTINSWVEDQTKNKIIDLVPRGALTADTRLVLVNALYLKAPWQNSFEKTATQDRPFRVRESEARAVPTMHDIAFRGHAAEDGLTVVTVNYLGSGLQFVVMLPAEGRSVDSIAAKLTTEDFARWAKLGAEVRPVSVSLFLPKFRIEGATIPLGQALRALGVKNAFDEPQGTANFDRIAPRKPDDYLALSEVFHQTFIALDEEGTEAAAATAVTMVTLAASAAPSRPVEVRVDRPFLFAIQHRASGTCLFLGRIMDPR